MPAPQGRGRLIGFRNTPRRGPIHELPADHLTWASKICTDAQARKKGHPHVTPPAEQRLTQETHACAMGPERLSHCCFVLEPSNRVWVSR
jgi:hypothetical protein